LTSLRNFSHERLAARSGGLTRGWRNPDRTDGAEPRRKVCARAARSHADAGRGL
jgi:hypothetical protein